MSHSSTASRAAANPLTHGFDRRTRSYVEYGPHEQLLHGPFFAKFASPPIGTENGTHHGLKSPNGGLHVMMWQSKGKIWLPRDMSRSHRMGYSADYLSSHGWQYIGPAF